MRWWFSTLMVTMVFLVSGSWQRAEAADDANEAASGGAIGLGYHDSNAPIGVRYWFGSGKVAIDGALGMTADRVVLAPEGTTTTLIGYRFSVGLPLMFKSFGKLHVMFRPGGSFAQRDEVYEQLTNDISGEATTFDVVAKRTTFDASFELEAEYFLVQRFSVSLGYGAQFTSSSHNVTNYIRDFSASLTPTEYSAVSFHLYLWGVK